MNLRTISYSINQTKLKTYIKMKTILLSIALLFAVSCKKNKSIEPEKPTNTIEVVDTNSVITPTTITVPTNTIQVSITVKTINGNYNNQMIPPYTGSYKIGFMYRINSKPMIVIPDPVLNDPGNPRTLYINNVNHNDTLNIYYNLIPSGSTSHNNLPSTVVSYNQNNNVSSNGWVYLQDKNVQLTWIVQ